MKKMFSTREVAKFLDVNEKMVYNLVAEKGLPGSKVTGKWLFPKQLVEQWIEAHTINYPEPSLKAGIQDGVLIIAGSNDPLLENAISFFNSSHSDKIAVFGNLGSMGGINALKRNSCHMAASHLLEEDASDYNFGIVGQEFENLPVVVNFCRREQGILLGKGNPFNILKVEDLGRSKVRIVNRKLGTGTRLLFDHVIAKAGLTGDKLSGYAHEVSKHMDVGLEILSGKADAGPGIRPIAGILGLDFIPLRWERYDLLIKKEHFFDKLIQQFLSVFHENEFKAKAEEYKGYDISSSGRMVFPQQDIK